MTRVSLGIALYRRIRPAIANPNTNHKNEKRAALRAAACPPADFQPTTTYVHNATTTLPAIASQMGRGLPKIRSSGLDEFGMCFVSNSMAQTLSSGQSRKLADPMN